MMDEQKIREEAWQEGRTAGYRQHVLGDLADRPVNPYAPVVKYTPTYMEVHKALLNTFTEDEIVRYLGQRERDIAEYERGMVVNKLEVMKLRERRIYEEERQAMKLARSHIISLPERGFLDSRARDGAVGDCIAVIKRMTG
jgi:hypothetical protein